MKLEFMKQMFRKSLCVSSVFLSLVLLTYSPVLSDEGGLYKWVDEKGTVHFTDSLAKVPPQHRNKVEEKTPIKGAGSAQDTHSPESNTSQSADLSVGTLNRFEVPYKGLSKRIIIPVIFNGSVTAPMLLDTGATNLLISPDLADRLRLFDKQHGKMVTAARGIGGPVPAIITIIDKVSVNGASAKFIPATIAPIASSHFEGLMGMDFMANYKISIDTHKHVVTFEELSSTSDMPGGHDKTWWQDNFRKFSGARVAWKNYLDRLEKVSMQTSETKWLKRIAEWQYNEVNKLHSKLEQYATWNSVPTHWRR